jgi:membrane-bound metal-dependent hydrolase YbcI (DUF457 family)
MMGRTHALTGAVAGAATSPLVGLDTLAGAAPWIAATAGAAVLPDLDHPRATASRILGPASGVLSWVVRRASSALYAATRTSADGAAAGEHRHLTHTIVGSLAAGGLCAATTALWGPVAALVWLAVLVLLAVDRIGAVSLLGVAPLGVAWAASVGGDPAGWWPAALDAAASTTGWLGLAVALGCLVHMLGDMLTLSGCPALWPVPLGGERWREITTPRALSFRTGGAFERLLVEPLCLVAAIAALPGIWPVLSGLASNM